VSAAAGRKDVREDTASSAVELVLRHSVYVVRRGQEERRGIDGGFEREGGTDFSTSMEDGLSVYVCIGGRRGEGSGKGGDCWPRSKQFQIRLALPPKRDGEFHYETMSRAWTKERARRMKERERERERARAGIDFFPFDPDEATGTRAVVEGGK
jgi:hypothetical protein